MDLLIYFALPVSTIIFAIVLEELLRSPVLVALATFAAYLIVTFTAFDTSFLINTIIYTILAYIAARLYRLIKNGIQGNWTIRNLNTENINTDTLNANQLNVNDYDNENNGNCNRYYRQYYNRNCR